MDSNGNYGARVRSIGDLAILTIAENTMTENNTNIGADGIGATVFASANSITSSNLGMERTNGATFNSFGSNIGSFNTSAGIDQNTGAMTPTSPSSRASVPSPWLKGAGFIDDARSG